MVNRLKHSDIGITLDPTWAQNHEDNITALEEDLYNNGTLTIPQAAITITEDFEVNGFNIIESRSIRFSPLTDTLTAADIGSVYNKNDGNLYYRNLGAQEIQITNGNSLNLSSITYNVFERTAPAGNISIDANDTFVIIDVDTTAARNVFLPAASGVIEGRYYIINDKNFLSQTNNITIIPDGSDTINGSGSNKKIDGNGSGAVIYSDGTSNWQILYLVSENTATGEYNFPDVYINADNNLNLVSSNDDVIITSSENTILTAKTFDINCSVELNVDALALDFNITNNVNVDAANIFLNASTEIDLFASTLDLNATTGTFDAATLTLTGSTTATLTGAATNITATNNLTLTATNLITSLTSFDITATGASSITSDTTLTVDGGATTLISGDSILLFPTASTGTISVKGPMSATTASGKFIIPSQTASTGHQTFNFTTGARIIFCPAGQAGAVNYTIDDTDEKHTDEMFYIYNRDDTYPCSVKITGDGTTLDVIPVRSWAQYRSKNSTPGLGNWERIATGSMD